MTHRPLQQRLHARFLKLNPVAMLLALAALTPCAWGAALKVDVRNDQDAPVADAVVSLYAREPVADQQSAQPRAVMDQIDKRFVPHVLPVRAGTAVSFPNSDDIRHHVYSFSKPKRFEIKLYTGVPGEPVVFDEPGVVVLGCNIHDWMRGYILVADTPHFAKTDGNGNVDFEGVPAGSYQLSVWHPWLLPLDRRVSREIRLDDALPSQARVELELTEPQQASQRPPSLLQEKFRRFRREDP